MTPASTSIIYLLYSSKDEVLCTWLNSYLNELKLKGRIGRYTSIAIETLRTSGNERERLRNSRDIVLLLASPNWLKSDFVATPVFQKLLDRHALRRSLLIPLYFFESGEIPQRLHQLTRLQNNRSTIVFHNTSALHEQLVPLFAEFETIVTKWETYNKAIDDAWEVAKVAHTQESYQHFEKVYPHSVYTSKAKQEAEALKEEDLWQAALNANTMTHYFKYLSEAPLKKYEEACILKILEFESKQDIAQIDAIKNQSIPLALDYQAKYDPKHQSAEINQHLYQLFTQRTPLNPPPLQTEGFFLQQEALKNSTPDEVFSLQLSLRYGKHLERRLSQLINKLRSYYASYVFMVALSIILFAYLFFYNALNIFHPGKINLSLFLAYIFLAYTAYRCLIGSSHAEHRVIQHQDILQQIKKDHIYLQIATINRDDLTKKEILFRLADTNFHLVPYEEASVFSFIQLSEELEEQQELGMALNKP